MAEHQVMSDYDQHNSHSRGLRVAPQLRLDCRMSCETLQRAAAYHPASYSSPSIK